MGKSFNDDVFNNSFNLDTINGLNISQEAINENKKETEKPKININLDEVKKEFKEQKENKTISSDKEEIQETIKQQTKQRETKEQLKDISDKNNLFNSELYAKKTMIFKQDYLNIIDGLASLNDMQIKEVLNQLLERAINELDDKTREKAIKERKKAKTNNKTDKSIF